MGETEQSYGKLDECMEGNVIRHKGDQQACQMQRGPWWDFCTDVKMTNRPVVLGRAASAKYISLIYWPLLLLTPEQEQWILNQISSGQCIPSEIALQEWN